MSCSASGSRTQFTNIKEIDYGVTPTIIVGDTKVVPFVSNSINLTKSIFEDPSILSNRQSKFSRHGNVSVAGDISFAYAYDNYDFLLESVFFNTFNTDVLKIGQELQSYTVQNGHLDINQYRQFTGLVGNSLSLEVNLDGVVSSTFNLMGQGSTVTQVTNDASPTAQGDYQPMVHFDGTFKEGGVSTAILTSISLNIDNGLTQDYGLGDDEAVCLTSSTVAVNGTVTAFFKDEVLLEKFMNETSTSLEFTIGDGLGNTHTYNLPNVKYNSADIDVSDGSSLPITLEFQALYDDTIDSILSITRASV